MIALYSRVSTAEQAKEGYSIGEQVERLKDYCRALNLKGYKTYTDAGYSGGNINRPALQEMIKDAKAGKLSKVIVYKLDRLSRSQKDTLELIEDIFLAHNVDFISISENFDTSSPFGKAMIGILAVFSQLEREQIKERVTIGREARAKKGLYHGGSTPPVGYDYIDGRLIINDFEAMQIREAHRLYQSGYTYTEIAELFNAKHWYHKNGAWLLQRVRYVLQNPIYTGSVSFGGQRYEGMHEPIIDADTFNTTAEMIARNKKSRSASVIHDAYFVGKIWCARCGARYCHTSTKTRGGKRISYYICYSKAGLNKSMIRDPNCKNHNYRCDILDETIFKELRGLVLSDALEYRKTAGDGTDKAAAIRREISKIEKQRDKLIELYSLDSFTAEELTKKIEPLNDRRAILEKQIQELASWKRSDEEIKQAIESIGDILDSGDTHLIKQLIDALIEKIEIDGDDITIYWNFD